MKIDAHHHFWKYDPLKQEWINDEMTAIRKDFIGSDLQPELHSKDIDGTVVVQADQTLQENQFLLELAGQNPFVKGIVGWVDFKSQNLTETLETYKKQSLIKGFRHVIQGEPQGFMKDQNFVDGLKKLKNFNFTYDLLIFEHQLEEAYQMVKKLDSPIVLDHIAKPRIKDQSIDHWDKYMQLFSEIDHVYIKLSGMITEANWKSWSYHDLEPYMSKTLNYFGANRILYGSDWPVCLVAGTYDQVYSNVSRFIQALSSSEQENILGNNACQFYSL